MYIAQFMARCGVCSRRKAVQHIKSGEVVANGKVVDEFYEVQKDDFIKLNGKRIEEKRFVYILLNKPMGFITSRADENNRKTVLDLIKHPSSKFISPVGRLDYNTSGVLLLTNDGDMIQKLIHPKNVITKRYFVQLSKRLPLAALKTIQKGIRLEDGFVKVDKITYVRKKTDQVIVDLHTGKKRIIRRIFEQIGYLVNELDRLAFAGITHKNLKVGDWRFLTDKEIKELRDL
jgi:23S rRNA pseudouridine2605 synthase